MKKKAIGLAVLLVLLIAAVIGYFVAQNAWGDDTGTDTGTADPGYEIYACPSDNVSGFRVGRGDEGFSLSRKGEGWQNDADAHFPVDAEAAEAVAALFDSVGATRKFEGEKLAALSEYGLDAPALTLTVTEKSGGSVGFLFGNFNRHSNGYYCKRTDGDAVYLVSSEFYSGIDTEEKDFLLLESLPSVLSSDVTKIEGKTPDGAVLLTKKTVPAAEPTDTDGSDTTDTETDTTVYVHTNTVGGTSEMSEDEGLAIIGGFTSLYLSDCADYYAEDGELASYGLDEAHRTTVTLCYTVTLTSASDTGATGTSTEVEKTTVLHIGAPVPADEPTDGTDTEPTGGTDKVYLSLDGSRMVYRVSLGDAAAFFS